MFPNSWILAFQIVEGSCIKESLTANDNGLKEGMTLFLKEEGVAYTEDIKLNAILVINNSNEHRYLKMDQVGNRIEKKTITISTNTEVQQLRDKLGVLFLNYEEGWTKRSVECIPDCYILENNSEHFTSETVVAAGDKSDVAAIGYGVQENGNEVNKNSTIIDLTEDSMDVPPDTKLDRPYKGGRLRTTTWMKECGELIGEVNSKGHARTLKEAGVKDGDTVLFEEGDLPTKGQMTFKVFVWKPDTLASSPSTNASSFREMSMNDKSDSVTEESTSLAMEVSKTETALEYADRIRRSVLSELCTVVANEEVSLVTLHNLVYNYIVNSNSLDCYGT